MVRERRLMEAAEEKPGRSHDIIHLEFEGRHAFFHLAIPKLNS
jgi:hypothetical protein